MEALFVCLHVARKGNPSEGQRMEPNGQDEESVMERIAHTKTRVCPRIGWTCLMIAVCVSSPHFSSSRRRLATAIREFHEIRYFLLSIFQTSNSNEQELLLMPFVQSSTCASCAGYLLAARQLRDTLMYDEWIKGPLGKC